MTYYICCGAWGHGKHADSCKQPFMNKFVFYWSPDEKRWVKIGIARRQRLAEDTPIDGLWDFDGEGSGFGPWKLQSRNIIARKVRELMRKHTPDRWSGKVIHIRYAKSNPPKAGDPTTNDITVTEDSL